MKIQKIENLINNLKKKYNKKRHSFLCHGVFDILHLGHTKYLNFAKNFKQ